MKHTNQTITLIWNGLTPYCADCVDTCFCRRNRYGRHASRHTPLDVPPVVLLFDTSTLSVGDIFSRLFVHSREYCMERSLVCSS